MDAQIGAQLGDYRLVRELGTGIFGTVFQAEQVYLGTQVAIKVLLGQITEAERVKLRVEARRQAALEHPHIVQVLTYSEQNGLPYLVMKYAPNGTLRERYPMGQRCPLGIILPHVRQIAEGLQHAHNMNTLHLDLKPANLLLGRQHEVLICDFGIAVILQTHRTHQTMSGFAGTPTYAAPEQLANRPSKASDQYALATMVYQWLTGTLPFVGDLVALVGQKLNQDAPPLRSCAPDLPPAVEAVVLRALAKAPGARYPSVLEFAQALEGAVRPAPPYKSATRPVSPQPAVVPTAPLPQAPPVNTASLLQPLPAPTPPPPKTKEQWLDEGNAHWRAKRYSEALAAYEQMLHLDPKEASAWMGKGNVLYDRQRFQVALAAYEQALSLDPRFVYAWTGKGNVLRDLKRYPEALAAYEQALRLDPRFPLAWHGKGNALRDFKRHEEALAAYEQAAQLDPTLAIAWGGKGNVLLYLQRYSEALVAYEVALRLDPAAGFAWQGKGRVLMYLQHYAEALAAFEQVLLLDPRYAYAWAGKALALERLGQPAEAQQARQRARDLGYSG